MSGSDWSWWAARVEGPDDKPESYSINEPTREAVIAAARREEPDGWIAIIEATQEGPFDAHIFEDGDDLMDRIVDRFMDANGDRWGEDSDPPMINAAEALNAALEQYVRENHCQIMEAAWSFTATRNIETLPPLAAND